jgi:hypothetical protein
VEPDASYATAELAFHISLFNGIIVPMNDNLSQAQGKAHSYHIIFCS